MRNRNFVAVDRIAVTVVAAAGCRGWLEMRDDLMAEEIEVDPLFCASALWAAENGPIKMACGF